MTERAEILIGLGGCLKLLFDRKGLVHDLEEAIQLLQIALLLLPAQHPRRPFVLHLLGLCSSSLYRLQERIENLNDSIQCIREASALYTAEELPRSGATKSLSLYLVTRHIEEGRGIQDLEEAIRYTRASIHNDPVGHPSRLHSLLNLSMCLCMWHGQRGGLEELEEAIQYLRELLSTYPSTSPERQIALGAMGNCLRSRFQQEPILQYLEDAILCYRETLSLLPSDSSYVDCGGSLINLSNIFLTKYEFQNSIHDLDEATRYVRKALSLCSAGDRPGLLSHLANCLQARYKHYGDVECLWNAIQYHREALSLHPPGHASNLYTLMNLSSCLESQYYHNGVIQDLKEAVESLRKVIHEFEPMNPSQSSALARLASMYAKNAEVLAPFYDVTIVSTLFQKASSIPTASFRDRISASQQWIREVPGPSRLSAYQQSLELVDQHLLIRPSIASRHQLLQLIPDEIALDAVATAIECGEMKTAVEFLEQGRTLLWSQMNRYRTPTDRLRNTHPELAAEFIRLSQQLESSATSRILMESSQLTAEEETRKYRKIADNWSAVVEKIRQLDGFDTFLHPPQYSYLRTSSQNGPVIIVNVSSRRCDAIIIQAEGDPVLVPLPDTRRSDVHRHADKFLKVVKAGVVDRPQIFGILRALWDDIVQRVVSKLQELQVAPGSRIWWCPTSALSMLPIHAAGPHRGKKPNLYDIYTSSYIPTLTTLAQLNQAATSSIGEPYQPHCSPRLLVVAQPDTPGQVYIPYVKEELSIIQKQIRTADVLLNEEGTHDMVLAGLKTHSWVHFSCHGSQDLKEPFESCFRLHDKPLTLLDIVEARVPDGRFAFLSACHSAATDVSRPDETIHLAAAIQFTGFRSVIGTMYAMADIDGPVVAEEVYKHIYRWKEDGEQVDCRDAAEALSIAIRKLRENGVPVERWINFVHFGA